MDRPHLDGVGGAELALAAAVGALGADLVDLDHHLLLDARPGRRPAGRRRAP